MAKKIDKDLNKEFNKDVLDKDLFRRLEQKCDDLIKTIIEQNEQVIQILSKLRDRFV